MDRFETGQRPLWLDALIGLGIGAAGQLLISAGLVRGAGWDGPVVTILAPTAVGIVAAMVVRSGWGLPGMIVGMVVIPQILPSVDPAFTVPATLDLVVSLGAGLFGYGIGWAIVQQASVPYMMRPPAAADLGVSRRRPGPSCEGSTDRHPARSRKRRSCFGQSTSRSRAIRCGEGRVRPGRRRSRPHGLLDLQAELVETARVAAMAAGARRVTITSSGMGGGIDVQAVFGDPIGIDEQQPPTALDVD